jgi:hypothetical protein
MMQPDMADMQAFSKRVGFHPDKHSRLLSCVMAEMNLMQREPTIRKIRMMTTAELVLAIRRRMLTEP